MLIDHKLKPWLLEINSRPSFRTETPIDKKIKRGVVYDAIHLLNIDPNDKLRYE